MGVWLAFVWDENHCSCPNTQDWKPREPLHNYACLGCRRGISSACLQQSFVLCGVCSGGPSTSSIARTQQESRTLTTLPLLLSPPPLLLCHVAERRLGWCRGAAAVSAEALAGRGISTSPGPCSSGGCELVPAAACGAQGLRGVCAAAAQGALLCCVLFQGVTVWSTALLRQAERQCTVGFLWQTLA